MFSLVHRVAAGLARITEPRKLGQESGVIFGAPRAGIRITSQTAITYSAVYSAVRLISETLGMLPWHVYRREGRSRIIVDDHPADALIHGQPNPDMSGMSFRSTLEAHALLWGNGYAEIERFNNGDPAALWLLPPDRTRLKRDADGQIQCIVSNQSGGETPIPYSDTFHIAGLGGDGIIGYAITRLAREAISMGLAMEGYGAAFFGNDAQPGMVLLHPGTLSEPAQERLKKKWNENHRGVDKSHRVSVLEEGMDIKTYSIPPEEAQFLQSRKFQITDIARWFRVPPHKIGDLERATFSNIEAQNIDFVTQSIIPWGVRWEQEADRKLLRSSDTGHFTSINFNGLLRGDSKARGQFYRLMQGIGVLSINEIRELENMNPIEYGDLRLVPLNMVSLEIAATTGTTAAPGAPGATKQIDASGFSEQQIQAAHISVFEDVAERMMRVEANAMTRLARKHGEERTDFFAAMRKFGDDHKERMIEAFTPAAQAVFELAGAQQDNLRIPAILDDFCQNQVNLACAEYFAVKTDELKALADDRVDTKPMELAQELLDILVPVASME